LITEKTLNPNSNSYRKLIHCVWLIGKGKPENISFDELRCMTKLKSNVRLHLPDEPVLYQHYKRVSGAFKYMLTYIFNTPMIDWSQYGYKLDNEKKCYYPAIFMTFKPSLKTKVMNSDDNKENNIRKKNRKSATQLNLLNEAFEEQPFLEDVKLECLTNETKLSKKVIRDWFSKERKRKGTPLQDITI